MPNTADQHGHPYRSVFVITAIGGRETAAGTTIEIVRVTPIGTGDSAVVATIPEQGEVSANRSRPPPTGRTRHGPTDRAPGRRRARDLGRRMGHRPDQRALVGQGGDTVIRYLPT